MNGIVDTREFSDALSRVIKLAAKRGFISILEQIKVTFTGTTCTLTATDLEQWGTVELPAQGDDFSFVLGNAKEVLKMLDKQSGPLLVAYEPAERLPRVKLECGGRESQFFVDQVKDYPEWPQVEALQTYHVDSGVLLDKVSSVSYAAAEKSESRPISCGASFMGKEIYCVDGYRMAVAEQMQMDVEAPFSVPVRMFKNWRALFPAGDVTLGVGKQYIRVSAPGITALFRLLEGENLCPQNVFPTSCKERYQVDPKECARELNYLNSFVTQPIHQPVEFRGGRLTVMTVIGSYSGRINVEGTAEIVYGFQVGYMLEAMKQFGDQQRVTVEVSHPNGPIVLRADDGRKTLILPLHLKNKENQAA